MKRLAIPFFATFFCASILAWQIHSYYAARQLKFIRNESLAIQTQLEERFKLYVRSTLALKKMADEVWQQPTVSPAEFAGIGNTVLSIYNEVVGANLVHPSGKIIQVHPLPKNARALGRQTQNIKYLRANISKGYSIWMSPPFDLLQGMPGFVYYFPLNRGDKFLGWYGVVVDKALFLKQFLGRQQFRNFHIQLSDAEYGGEYISTAPLPKHERSSYVRTTTFNALNRNITLKTWPKDPAIYTYGTGMILLLSLLMAVVLTTAWYFYEQRKNSRRQINELNSLLRHIIHDTANSVSAIKGYVEMLREDPRLVPVERLGRNVGFVVELLEQIKLIRGLADHSINWEQTKQSILPLLLETIELVNERLQVKHLALDYNPEDMAQLNSKLNKSLFIQVLSNVLNTLERLSSPNSTATLTTARSDGRPRLIFYNPEGKMKLEKADEMSLTIAKQVMELQGGDIHYSLERGLEVQISLP